MEEFEMKLSGGPLDGVIQKVYSNGEWLELSYYENGSVRCFYHKVKDNEYTYWDAKCPECSSKAVRTTRTGFACVNDECKNNKEVFYPLITD